MNVSVDNLGACKKLLRVEVSEGKVNSTFDEIASQFQKQVQLPGFRPGKAPAHLIAASFEGKIKEETRKKLFQDSYKAAAEKEKLRVIVTLNVEEQQFGRSMPYSYTVTCETAPEFEIPEYKGLRAKREISSATETDVTRALNILRDQHVKYNDVDRELRDGDVAF